MLMGLVTLNVLAQTAPGGPKLVVGIVVDQLRTDYIEFLRSHLGEKGFRRLMENGAYLRDVDFRAGNLDAASATAMLYTGAYPSKTGVPSALVFDEASGRLSPALADTKTLGNFSNDSYSPEQLRLSTLSDELAISNGGLGTVYALSADPQQAIIMAGHAGTGGAWINNTTGNWASTSWYKPMPAQLSSRNYTNAVSTRLDTMQWKPLIPLDRFQGLPKHKTLYPFKHTFPRSDKEAYIKFAASPMGNREVTDMAIECLKGMQMGAAGQTLDMLNIGYTLAPYRYVKDGDARAELADSYVRLDRELERLFDAIDRIAGPGNAVIWLSSTGYFDDAVIDDPKYRIPSGEFSTKRGASLLNSYLSARYGNAQYVKGFRKGQLYLDHKAISDRNLNADDVTADARQFLARMSGVADVFAIGDILSPSTPEEEQLRLSLDPKRCGDLIIKFAPGWTVTEDMDYPSVSYPVRESAVLTPAFILGSDIAPQTIDTPVDATALAPTVAGVLRIRSPNGSETRPLALKRNLGSSHHTPSK